MRDDIQHRLADLGRAAERAAAPVGFDGVRRRALRRRRARTLSAVVLCIVAAAGAGLGLRQAAGPGRAPGPVHHGRLHPSPTPTAPTPTSSPSPARLTARQIVADPRSFVVASSVDPHDVAQAATLWMLGPAGAKTQVAIATTSDGYRHVSYVPLPEQYGRDCDDVRALGHQHFWLSCGSRQLLVGSDGSVTVPSRGAPAGQMPNDAGLVAQPGLGKGADWSWLDSQGVMHALNVPLPGPTWLVHASDGRIWGIAFGQTNNLVWSTDGGRSWSSRALPGPSSSHTSDAYEIVPTAVPGRMVLARGVAETVFSPHSILTFGSDGQQLQQVGVSTGHASMDSAVVTPDGSLVMELYDEPDGSSGLFRGAPGHWTELHKVMDLPTDAAGRPAAARWMGSTRDSSGQPLLWAVFGSGVLATSTDDGRTWTTRSMR